MNGWRQVAGPWGVAQTDEDTRLYSVGARLALNPPYFYLAYNGDQTDLPGVNPSVGGREIIAKLTYLMAL